MGVMMMVMTNWHQFVVDTEMQRDTYEKKTKNEQKNKKTKTKTKTKRMYVVNAPASFVEDDPIV